MQPLNAVVGAHRRERDLTLRRAVVPRQLASSLSKALSSRLVKVITGPRRAGMRVKADRKLYAFDNGFISAKSQPVTRNDSRPLENLVFVELVRRGFKPNLDLFYYQTRAGAEVDFLLRRGSENLELIQVTQNLSSLKTREREIRALRQGAEDLELRRLTVITLDTEERIREAGTEINVTPCRTWLTRHS
jgi:hypothetical protein